MQKNDYNSGLQLEIGNFSSLFPIKASCWGFGKRRAHFWSRNILKEILGKQLQAGQYKAQQTCLSNDPRTEKVCWKLSCWPRHSWWQQNQATWWISQNACLSLHHWLDQQNVQQRVAHQTSHSIAAFITLSASQRGKGMRICLSPFLEIRMIVKEWSSAF